MDPLPARHTRPERLVAFGRLVLAASSLLAIWLDPAEPAKYAALTYTLLAGYVVYALLLMIWAALTSWLSRYIGLVTHLLDLGISGILLYLTEGSASPLFAYFLFLLLAAALRWGWQGVLGTALATIATYVAVSLYAERVLLDPAFELNRFIIRSVYLAVAALLLGYLRAYEQQLRNELLKLAAWPRHVPRPAQVEQSVRAAASVLEVRRVVMVWDEPEEPWRYYASLLDLGFTCVREASASAGPLVPEPLADRDFLCANLALPRPAVLYRGPQGLARWHGPPLTPEWQARLGCRSVLSLCLEGEGYAGRLLALDKRALSADDLTLGGIVARQVSADLDQHYSQGRLQQVALAEERVRFARDLHDGVLQTMTGLALQLKTVQGLLCRDAAAARAQLAEIADLIAAEQRDLRFFVGRLKPSSLEGDVQGADLASHLAELGRRAQRQWGLRVELVVEPLSAQLPETLAHAVYRVTQEALANAARHGGARLMRVRLALNPDRLRLEIADDGSGFAFRGRHDAAALERLRAGPASIRQRVAALGGELWVVSEDSGARLEIELPLPLARPDPAIDFGTGPPAAPRPQG